MFCKKTSKVCSKKYSHTPNYIRGILGDDSGNLRKKFNALSERQKWRHTKYMRSFPKEHIRFISKKQFKSKDAQFVLDFLRKHPEHSKSIRQFCESLEKPKKKVHE